jgi:hypothetical protein
MKKLLFVAAALMLLVAASCKNTASNYYPLAKGNIWNYLITVTTVNHGTVDTTITTTDSTSTTVLTDTTISGKSAWKLQNTTHRTTTSWYVVEENDRVVTYLTPDDTMPELLLVLPLAQNATWVIDSTRGNGRYRATVKDKENVTVPAGAFSSWKIEHVSDSAPQFPLTKWYGGGEGLVKTLFSMTLSFPHETTTVTTTDELQSATIK